MTASHAGGPGGGSARRGFGDSAGDAFDQPGPDQRGGVGRVDDADEQVIEGEVLDDEPDDSEEGEQTFVDGTVGRSDLAAERDEYLEALQRVKAEFDNYRRRTESQRNEMVERSVGKVVEQLLPILDACDAAVGHGATEVEPIHTALLETLGREGLERMDVLGKPFDPNLHEAVMHEPGDGDEEVVVEVFRNGYTWKGRVLRPAMVKVRG